MTRTNRKRTTRASPRRRTPGSSLRFTPYAWAKLIFLRDAGPTEIGGFGISAAGDPLLVEDVRLVRQDCTKLTTAFRDDAVADFFDACVDESLPPDRFGRIWLHTHPGRSAEPSATDEATFAAAFGRTDWAVMGILARAGATNARLRFHVGPGGEIELPVEVDFGGAFAAADRVAWQAEYAACVEVEPLRPTTTGGLDRSRDRFVEFDDFERPDWFDEAPFFSRKEEALERLD